jgi:DsbC/DsbD-like thiol-disulfide interchange protein
MRTALVLAAIAQLTVPVKKPGHATIIASPANVSGTAGETLVLVLDVTPKPGMHVYAPGNADYIPITVKLSAAPEIKAGKLGYPKSDVITLADEKVSVFQKPFQLTQDVTLDTSAKAGSTVAVAGTVNFQACDDKVCYPPENAPVSWTIAVK